MRYSLRASRAASRKMASLRISSSIRACDIDVYWSRIRYEVLQKSQTNMHAHHFFELHLALEGGTGFQFDQRKIYINKGEFLLIPPKIRHEYCDRQDDFEDFIIGFLITFRAENSNGQLMQQAFDKLEKDIRPTLCTERMLLYAQHIEESAYMDYPGTSAIVEAYLQLMLLEIARQMCPLQDFRETNRRFYESDYYYEKTKQYIAENLSQKLTAEMVASHLFISTKQLNRILADNFQTSISQVIRETRLQQIRQFLEHTTLTLSQIAERTGFSNEFNMSRFFKDAEGIAPGTYRKSFQQF